MNRIYRSIWNDATGTYAAASEHAHSFGKKSSPGVTAAAGGARFALKGLAVAVMLAFGSNGYALPTGGAVSAGSASIASAPGAMTINQSSQNVAINWQSFNIGQTEAVRFVQPNSSSVALNRVLGADPSSILGSLTANGKVFVLNPNGILFGKGAQVNVGGLVASTLSLSDGDFMAGRYNFTGAGSGTILNQGSITAEGGYVALLGATVSNEGVISARLGTVALAAGNAITLDVAGDGLLNVAVNQGAVNALVQNGGLIRADGGQVLLTAQAAGNLLQSVVNNTGVIQAQSVENHNGTIRLLGDMQSGTVNVSGTLDASAPNGGNGGFIETSAAIVNIANDAKVTTAAATGLTGTWLIDPQDFTIQAGFNISGATLSALLGTNSVIITTNTGADTTVAGTPPVTTLNTATVGLGDINVNEAVTKANTGTTTTLTLNAFRDVNINAAITTTFGNLVACCGRDVNVNAAITTTDGSVTFNSGRDINILAAMTTTRGNVILRAGSDGTGPAGLIGGTVFFGAGGHYTVTGTAGGPTADVSLYYTPTSYATPSDYSGNFTLSAGATLATLTQYMLVFPQGNNKVYDGNITATLTFKGDPTAGGVNAVTLVKGAGSATFDNKNVGNGKTITYTGYSLGGANAGNFDLWFACGGVAGAGTTTANITPLNTNISGTRVYDATPTAAGTTLTTISGLIGGDTVSVTGSGAVATKDVGVSKAVTNMGTLALAGTDAGNYNLVGGAMTITPLNTDISGTRVYDATTAAVGTILTTISALLGGDTVSVTGSGAVATKDVGVSKAVTNMGTLALAGTDRLNYTLVNGALTVTPAPLTLQANDNTKVYGQTFTPASTAFTTPVFPVGGDTVTGVTETSTGSVATASVAGSTYPIVITPGSATGTFAASNYIITYRNGALTVTPAPLTVTANDAAKPAGTTLAFAGTEFTNTATQNGETVGSVTLVSAGTPASAAATTYPITPSSATGITASNYTITYVNGVLTVTPVPIPLVQPVPVVVAGETAVLPTATLAGTTLPGLIQGYTGASLPLAGLNLAVLDTGVRMPLTQLAAAPLVQPAPDVVVLEKPPVVAPPEVPLQGYVPPPINVPPQLPPRKDRN